MFMFGNFSGDPKEPFNFPIAEAHPCFCSRKEDEKDEGLQQVLAWFEVYKDSLVAMGDPFLTKVCHWGGTHNKSIHVIFVLPISESEPLSEGQLDLLKATSAQLGNVYKTCILNCNPL